VSAAEPLPDGGPLPDATASAGALRELLRDLPALDPQQIEGGAAHLAAQPERRRAQVAARSG